MDYFIVFWGEATRGRGWSWDHWEVRANGVLYVNSQIINTNIMLKTKRMYHFNLKLFTVAFSFQD